MIFLFGVYATGLIPFLTKGVDNSLVKPGNYILSFLVGVAFAACWSPDITPILASILMVAATEESIAKGLFLLFAFSFGLAVPFLFFAFVMHEVLTQVSKFKRYTQAFAITFGVLLMVVGLLVFNNYLKISEINHLLHK